MNTTQSADKYNRISEVGRFFACCLASHLIPRKSQLLVIEKTIERKNVLKVIETE